MNANQLASTLSSQLADAVAAAAPSVVQVHGRRRPASGIVYANGVVITTTRSLGRDDHPRVRTADGRTLTAELAGWDPATGLAVLRVDELGSPALAPADAPARVGELALAVARSWSNALTATAGIVAVIGGPLRTGHGRAIDQVIRTSAPMHDGFAGGAFIDPEGRLLGVATAAAIRGLAVVIPASIAWATAASLLEHGSLQRGWLGVAAQPVRLGERQTGGSEPQQALLIVGVSPGSPAEAAGVLVGDVLLEFDGQPVAAPEQLLDLLSGAQIGREATLRLLRGGQPQQVVVTIGTRPSP